MNAKQTYCYYVTLSSGKEVIIKGVDRHEIDERSSLKATKTSASIEDEPSAMRLYRDDALIGQAEKVAAWWRESE